MKRLKALWLVLVSRAFFVQSEYGFTCVVPHDPFIYNDLIAPAERLLEWLRDQERDLL